MWGHRETLNANTGGNLVYEDSMYLRPIASFKLAKAITSSMCAVATLYIDPPLNKCIVALGIEIPPNTTP